MTFESAPIEWELVGNKAGFSYSRLRFDPVARDFYECFKECFENDLIVQFVFFMPPEIVTQPPPAA